MIAGIGLNLGFRAAIQGRLAEAEGLFPTEDRAQCEAHPSTWLRSPGMLRLTAHYPDGTSANPLVEPISPELVPAVGAPSVQLPGGAFRFWLRRGVYRVAPDGPCAVLRAEMDIGPDGDAPLQVVRLLGALGAFLGTLVAMVGTSFFAVGPLLRRLEAVDRTAERVGTEAFEPSADDTEDALGRVSRTLDASHARIVADQAELEARRVVLQQHLAGVAHDLRTPIASLQLTLESLDAHAPDALRQEVGAARMELASIEALADNLLQASRLRGGLEVQGVDKKVDLREVCERLATRFNILGRARGIRVHAALPDKAVLASCDASLAERALANLLHNGLVHGPEGHAVGVSLSASQGRFALVVQTAGPVFDEGLLAALSERRLTRDDPARSRAQRGLGLGITNEVAERAGWTVRYLPGDEGGLRVELEGQVA